MEAIGGFVFRALRQTVVEDQWDRGRGDAPLRAEIDQLKAEHAKAAADRKNKLQTKIDSLNARREKKLEQSRLHAKQVERGARMPRSRRSRGRRQRRKAT